MRVQHNIIAMNSYRNYNGNTKQINKNIEKLSSGYKINRAGDDAAGLAISEKMRAQITGLEVAQKNAKDGISLVQTAEGALTEVHSMLNRMVTLAEQSANGTYEDSTDRAQLQKEVTALQKEIDRIADSSNFNGQNLLDGNIGGYGGVPDFDDTSNFKNMSVKGGSLKDGDTFTVEIASGAAGIKDGTIKIGGVELTNTGGTLTDANDVEVGTIEASDKNPSGGAAGIYRWTIKAASDKTAVSSAIDKALGDGVTLTANIKSFDDTTSEEVEFTASGSSGLRLQIGDTADTFNQLSVEVDDIHVDSLGVDDVDISTADSAAEALQKIKDAINTVSDVRGGLGAIQNRLEHTISNLSVMQENMQDAESTIRDTDVAAEMMKYTKNSILVQSAQAMLAQANQQPQGVLQLLQ